MARPVLHDETLRGRLLEVTAELVDQVGPAALSLRSVAREAGTSTTAIYALFGSKAQLLTALLNESFASFGAAQAAAAGDGLVALGVAYRRWALDHPARYRLMFGGALMMSEECAPDPELASAAMLPLRECVEQLQRDGTFRREEPTTVAAVIWAQVHGMVSIELAGALPHEADADTLYSATLAATLRAWTEVRTR
ncbi:TetR family transcriptional regulator [Aeromicrobium sp. PE09-221]|uniref:TetR/AcrR family transcriptional regulator n=1 Tax=Aeromicrobium sp. PE09-221 TaxID=1898043 RepID=UPI000B3EC796|nr:TetR/AcrR family transcriptional regulator [Aeromicrobium sp. PE09-221]OUZ07670.1 TetR family transcriptional regulator [Aeromicrobium sp. PE09-221]